MFESQCLKKLKHGVAQRPESTKVGGAGGGLPGALVGA